MRLSRSELYALVLRAARGAGVELSQAGELASIIRCLSPASLEDLGKPLCNALEAPRANPDADQVDGVWFIGGADPLHSIPAALDLALAGQQVRHQPGALLSAWAGARGMKADGDGTVTLSSVLQPSAGPVDLDDEVFARLDTLAWRTYVPATDQSRSGAGAGDIDND